jgi:glycosyltransferase involved in cell wall biosynthesis
MKLMVFINDSLSDLARKGEITDRYYNPGDLFEEVHIWMTNDDRPDPALLRKTVGSAALVLHNLPFNNGLFFKTLGWRPRLLKSWARPAIESAKQIRPALIRCHGNGLNGIPAAFIKESLGIPYVVSLHINPDENPVVAGSSWKARLLRRAMAAVEKFVLRKADRTLPVYEPIVPYLKRLGIRNFEVAYNVLNPAHLRKKGDYRLHNPVRVISVGRQMAEKNPENLIRAIRQLPDILLTIVGNGALHDHLVETARASGVSDRVLFRKAVPNDELCASLSDYDIFAVHTEYWEISKSVLEPLLTGLPVIINHRVGLPVPEFEGDFLLKVENTEDGYHRALKRLVEDHAFREELGSKAYAHAQENWVPVRTEQNFVRIYREVMENAGRKGLKAGMGAV